MTLLTVLPLVAGVDEAGRGCLAGPVVAGAVILPEAFALPGLTDSKKLTAPRRAVLAAAIKTQAIAWAVAMVWPGEIDRINILQATFAAMAKALAHLARQPALARIDGNKIIPEARLGRLVGLLDQEAIIGGDLTVPAISAASILAKTSRDRLLDVYDRRYPGYGFAAHKGYGVAAHLAALRALGPCPIHRLTFRGVLPDKTPRQLSLPGV